MQSQARAHGVAEQEFLRVSISLGFLIDRVCGVLQALAATVEKSPEIDGFQAVPTHGEGGCDGPPVAVVAEGSVESVDHAGGSSAGGAGADLRVGTTAEKTVRTAAPTGCTKKRASHFRRPAFTKRGM